jgi:hypothetical protein
MVPSVLLGLESYKGEDASYSGGRDQEDHGLRTVQANSFPDPILKKNHHKNRAGRAV